MSDTDSNAPASADPRGPLAERHRLRRAGDPPRRVVPLVWSHACLGGWLAQAAWLILAIVCLLGWLSGLDEMRQDLPLMALVLTVSGPVPIVAHRIGSGLRRGRLLRAGVGVVPEVERKSETVRYGSSRETKLWSILTYRAPSGDAVSRTVRGTVPDGAPVFIDPRRPRRFALLEGSGANVLVDARGTLRPFLLADALLCLPLPLFVVVTVALTVV